MAMIDAVLPLNSSLDPYCFTSNFKLKFEWRIIGITNHLFYTKGLKSINFGPP